MPPQPPSVGSDCATPPTRPRVGIVPSASGCTPGRACFRCVPTHALDRSVVKKEDESMSIRSLPFRVTVALSVVIGLMVGSLPIGFGVTAAPVRRSESTKVLQQAAGTDYPVSVTVQGEQFVFDRLVPLDREDFQRIADGDRIAFYARTESPPFDAIFGLISGRSSAGLARYLPTRADAPDTPCPAEEVETGALNAGEASYAFAGIEADIPIESLQQVATLEDQSV